MPDPQYACPRRTDFRERLTFSCRARKFVLSLGEADLTNAVNGGSQDFVLGNVPPGALFFAPPNIKLNAQFTGGGAVGCTLSVGTSAGPTLVATAFNIFGGAASGLFVAMAQGVQCVCPAPGQTLIARVTPDGAHNLAALTAGSLALEVYFFNGADSKYNA